MMSILFLGGIIVVLMYWVIRYAFKKVNIEHSLPEKLDELHREIEQKQQTLNMLADSHKFLVIRLEHLKSRVQTLLNGEIDEDWIISQLKTVLIFTQSTLYNLEKHLIDNKTSENPDFY